MSWKACCEGAPARQAHRHLRRLGRRGKTTTSAALAGLAAAGARVAVVTIDPARRLANALGWTSSATSRARSTPGDWPATASRCEGELWAMMLDAKRTFDELIELLAPDERTRDEVFANRIYQQLSGAVAGSQEFTAVAKLYELDRSGRFDVLVLDTPPSRNALDFLDAPDRLTGFFEGRAMRVFLAPTGLAARSSAAARRRLLGPQARDGRRPARRPERLLPRAGRDDRRLHGARGGGQARWPTTGDDVPGRHLARARPGRGGDLLHRKLRDAGMPFGGLVVNRVHPLDGGPPEAARRSPLSWEPTLARGARSRATRRGARAGAARRRAMSISLREPGEHDPIVIPQLDGDVHDVDGLVAIHGHLFAD